MLTLSSPALLTTAPTTNNGGGIMTTLNTGTIASGGILASSLQLTPQSLLGTVGTTPIPSYSGSTIALTIPSGVGAIGAIQINGQTFTPANGLTQSGNTITIALPSGFAPPVGTHVIYYGLSNSYGAIVPTTDVIGMSLPSLLRQWNVTGEINVNLGFEGQPSASFQFTTLVSNKSVVLAAFPNLAPISLYGIGFTVERCSITELPKDSTKDPLISVAASLTGRHVYALEEVPVKVLKLGKRGDRISIGAIALAAGTQYRGDDIQILIPQDATPETMITLSEALTTYARLIGGYVDYTDPDYVQIKPFGTGKEHLVVEPLIVGDIGYEYGGIRAYHDGIQTSHEYKNTELQLDEDSQADDPAKRTPIVLCRGNRSPGQSPNIELRSPSEAFDSGGTVKEELCTLSLNGSTLTETTRKYGFAYCTADVYTPFPNSSGAYAGNKAYTPSFVSQYWVQVELSETSYLYDSFGYLRKIEKTGWRLARLKAESGDETTAIDIEGRLAFNTLSALDRAKLEAELSLYRTYTKVPISGTTEFSLADLAAIYTDIPTPQTDPNIDPDEFVPSLYCKEEVTIDGSYQVSPDPRSTAIAPLPPLVTGRNFRQGRSTQIVLPTAGKKSTIELFRKHETTDNREGAGLGNGLRISTSEDVQGRPSPHTRADFPKPNATPLPLTPVDDTQYRYLLNSAGNGATAETPEQGSVSYVTSDPVKGLAAAQLDLCIANSADSERIQLKAQWKNDFYRPGDVVRRDGQKLIVFGVDFKHSITTGQLQCDGIDLQLGRYLNVPVDSTKLKA